MKMMKNEEGGHGRRPAGAQLISFPGDGEDLALPNHWCPSLSLHCVSEGTGIELGIISSISLSKSTSRDSLRDAVMQPASPGMAASSVIITWPGWPCPTRLFCHVTPFRRRLGLH